MNDPSSLSYSTTPFAAQHLPPLCSPTTPFLVWISSIFHTCWPTPLAFTSSLLGYLSVLSWLFAQLPQVIKNQRLRTTSGLSIYFLLEWVLGDVTNLAGGILTHQAGWQVAVATYYCFIDTALLAQWLWFDVLKRGAKPVPVWTHDQGRGRLQSSDANKPDGGEAMSEVVVETIDPITGDRQFGQAPPAKDVPRSKMNAYDHPNYGSIGSNGGEGSLPQSISQERIMRRASSSPLVSPSSRTLLVTSMVLCILSTTVSAKPISSEPVLRCATSEVAAFQLGTILSWTSSICYLGSRLPQLYKNWSLRSTEGLSPLLFLAAFHGNFFYSSSMLANPNLWHDLPPCSSAHGCSDPLYGWTGENGNRRVEWMLSALPFFIGAAVVLVMDAGIGLQFLKWGGGAHLNKTEDTVDSGEATPVLVGDAGESSDGRRKWREVSGWMRGWVPSVREGIRTSVSSVGGLRATGTLGSVMRRNSSPRVRPSSEEAESLMGRRSTK